MRAHKWYFYVFLLLPVCLRGQTVKYDVVVVGAGSGGFGAALQAARDGVKVALVEETDWVGGQMSAAAVSTMDEGGPVDITSGIYAEFLHKAIGWYTKQGKAVDTCYYHPHSHCFEPSVVQKVLLQMIDETRAQGHTLDLIRMERVTRVLMQGNTVKAVVLNDGTVLRAKIVIDATEFGDVIPLTTAAYRLSHYKSDALQKSGCVQDLTYVGVIRKYPHGLPPGFLMLHAPPGYDEKVEEYFHRYLRNDGNTQGQVPPVTLARHNIYRGLPDSSSPGSYDRSIPENITKSELNWFNDIPMTAADFDGEARRHEICQGKLRTLQELYYIQHEMGKTDWSLANDEGFDSAYNNLHACAEIPAEFKKLEMNLPPLPYVRESRRIIGVETLTAGWIRREGKPGRSLYTSNDVVALGEYADDLHGCNDESDIEADLEHRTDLPPGFRTGPFEIPIGVMIPIKVDGLLAAEKNISVGRIANGATRLQPVTMLVGQAAGALAAISVRSNVTPRDVSPVLVQQELLHNNVVLATDLFSDVPRNTVEWEAAQFAVARGWMQATEDHFNPNEKVTRAEAADVLAEAFHLARPFNEMRPAVAQKPTFEDVPLWNRYSGPIEAMAHKRLQMGCHGSASNFCPQDTASVADFSRWARELTPEKDQLATRSAVEVKGGGTSLTRILAAEILYTTFTQAAKSAASITSSTANNN